MQAEAQAQFETLDSLGVLFVQFSDSGTNIDAREGFGYIDTTNDGIPDVGIENKYRYQTCCNIFFDVNTVDVMATMDRFAGRDSATSGNNQRKLSANGPTIVMVHESNGLVFASKSTNAGVTWNICELNTAIDYDSTDRVTPQHKYESAPSVCWMGDASWMTWQREETEGIWSIVARKILSTGDYIIYAATIADTVVINTDSPTPVIGYGYQQSIGGQMIPIAKIVFATSEGLKESISTDAGSHWSDPVIIPGTRETSVRPSLAMNDNHMVLVYEEGEDQDLYYSVDGDTVRNLTFDFKNNGLSNNRYPSVTLNNDIVHIVWVADYTDRETGLKTQRAVHTQWNANAMPSSVLKTLFDRKYNGRAEYSEVPVLAVHPSGTLDKGATIFWSVKDILPGARLRFNRYTQNPKTGLYTWQFDMEKDGESGLSGQTTRHPAITELANSTFFAVTRGNAAPYQIATSYTHVDANTGKGTISLDIATMTTNNPLDPRSLMNVISEQPTLATGTQLLGVLVNAGVPDSGFDGSAQGPGIRELLRSESVLLDMSQSISWDMRVVFDSTIPPADTVFVIGRMLDASTGSVIASSDTIRRPIANRDSSFTLGFELPPSHWPQAEIAITVDVCNDPDSAPVRFLSVAAYVHGRCSAEAGRRTELRVKDFHARISNLPQSGV